MILTTPVVIPGLTRCIECHVDATAGVTSGGVTVWHCADAHHQLCARRVLGLADA
jgi:hypothetical protein